MARTEDAARTLHRKRAVALVSLGVVTALFVAATIVFSRWFMRFKGDPEAFTAFVESYGWAGRLVALGIQLLQVFVSIIPGELIEIGLGYAYGAWEGTLLCLGGVALGSSLIFLLIKRWGVRLVELFIPREKIDQLRFINSETKLKRLLFLLFFIPGTPKDLLTYFAGLTRIQLHEFLIITLIARIPSVISSTVGGNMIQEQDYLKAVCLFAVTGAVSLLGITLYNYIVKRKSTHTHEEKEDKVTH